jgi:hypothetical protein
MALSTTLQDKLGLTPHAVERKLDDAIEDSFPASDPVQLSMPHDREELNLHWQGSTTIMLAVGAGLLALLAFIALRR